MSEKKPIGPVPPATLAASHIAAALLDLHEGHIEESIKELNRALALLNSVEDKKAIMHVHVGGLRGMTITFP